VLLVKQLCRTSHRTVYHASIAQNRKLGKLGKIERKSVNSVRNILLALHPRIMTGFWVLAGRSLGNANNEIAMRVALSPNAALAPRAVHLQMQDFLG